jgi:hypothetical protein
MPPKRVVVQSGRREQEDTGLFGTAYKEITKPENTTIVRSVVIFSVCFPLSVKYSLSELDTDRSTGSGCLLPQQFERIPHSSVSP